MEKRSTLEAQEMKHETPETRGNCALDSYFRTVDSIFILFKPASQPLKTKRKIAGYLLLGDSLVHYFQPSFFSKTGAVSRGFRGFLERRIPGKNGEGSTSFFFFLPKLTARLS